MTAQDESLSDGPHSVGPAPLPPAHRRVLTPVPLEKSSAPGHLRRLVATMRMQAEVVTLGDSLVAAWPASGLSDAFGGSSVANLGLPGERIQNTLWRLDAVEASHLRPSWCLVLLGTNNLGDGDPPDAIAAGLERVLGRTQDLWGGPRLVLVTVPWREPKAPHGEGERLHLNDDILPGLARRHRALLVDADQALGQGRDGAAANLEADLLHLSAAGYGRLGRAVRQALPQSLPPGATGLTSSPDAS